jgi:hypothetical protein
LPNLFRWPFGNEAALMQDEDSLGYRKDDFHVMLGEKKGEAFFLGYATDQVNGLPGFLG